MTSEKFCLRWNDFERNFSTSFREIRDEKDFFDITLACEEEQIQAHKVILSACSPFFKNVLHKHPHAHPLLYLKGVKYQDLEAVLNFMYHGEVSVAEEELNSFLQVAEDLRVKGLTRNNASARATAPAAPAPKDILIPKLEPRVSDTPPSRPRPHDPTPFPNKRPRSSPMPRPLPVDDDIQEVVPIFKTEPRDQYGDGSMIGWAGWQATKAGVKVQCTFCERMMHPNSIRRHVLRVHTEPAQKSRRTSLYSSARQSSNALGLLDPLASPSTAFSSKTDESKPMPWIKSEPSPSSASHSTSILKRRRLDSEESPSCEDSPISTQTPRRNTSLKGRRVHFNEDPVSDSVEIPRAPDGKHTRRKLQLSGYDQQMFIENKGETEAKTDSRVPG